jgi:tetratricopeptide (TPR) repeat protein
MWLAAQRNNRTLDRTATPESSYQVQGDSDVDKAITHLTEAILLPFPPGPIVVKAFYMLAAVLLSRSNRYHQREDVKSSVKYFRFLRNNIRSLEYFDFSDEVTPRLVYALTRNVMLGSGDMIQNVEEIVELFPEVLTSDVLTPGASEAIELFAEVFAGVVIKTEILHRMQQLADRGIQMLREATGLRPGSHIVSYALACCLAARFEMTHVIDDYDDAIAIADTIAAIHSPGDGLIQTRRNDAMMLIRVLLILRLNSYSRLEYLEDAIHRLRTLLSLPYLLDQIRTSLADTLIAYVKRRSAYFGVATNFGETPADPRDGFGPSIVSIPTPYNWGVWGVDPASDMLEISSSLCDVATGIRMGEITDLEAAVELGRKSVPLQPSGHRLWYLPAFYFAKMLFEVFKQTEILEYLNEAIFILRDLYNASAPKGFHFEVGYQLILFVGLRHVHSGMMLLPPDVEECMLLFLELANDESREVFSRFKLASSWASMARSSAHPSIYMAYKTALSLLQKTLVFSPTLQIQHSNLAHVFKEWGMVPSNYASYQVERSQPKQAIESLERGRALLWSEMRGLRTSTDQLRAADTALADKLADINQSLELVTMSVARIESEERGDDGIESGRCNGVDSIGHLVTTQRRLLEERGTLVSHIQTLPGFENFLKPLSFDILNSAAECGPVIIINLVVPEYPSYVILLLKDSPPSVISTPFNFHHRARRLKNKLLYTRKERGLDSKDYGLTLASVLSDLYKLVGKPVIERLRKLKVPEKSRVWWCPTEDFCSLPLHAMGPIPSDNGKELYFSDLYIPSYTPTLSALIESRKPRSLSEASSGLKPSILLVAQPILCLGRSAKYRPSNLPKSL